MGGAALILLDTHVLVWLAVDPGRLSPRAASAIRRARSSDGLAIADITIWELANLYARGALRARGTVRSEVREIIEGSAVIVKPVTTEIAAIAAEFPRDYPSDPADRLIGATALADGLSLITRDQRMHEYSPLKTVW
jgi:PIN domain nuclease of toxin-antitoxin system